MNKICCIYNYAQHYRANIFTLMDRNLNCDFYFGTKMNDVRTMDYSLLKNFKKELKNVRLFSSIYYQIGAVKLLQNNYTHYIILGEPYCISTWFILILSKLYRNKKIIFWTHGWYGKETFFKSQIKKVFFKLADFILLYGDYAKKLMINENINPKKLDVIYNSLNYDEQIQIRKKLKKDDIYISHFHNDNPVLFFVGRLTKVKRLELLVEALYILNNETNKGKYNLVFIGEGTEKQELIELSNKLNLNSFVWFYGESYDENELSQLIYNAGLCVSPGNIGLTVIHSLSYGTPAITHDNFSLQMPEFESIVDGKTGTFFKQNDIKSLAEKIEWWFDQSFERETIRENCYQIIDSKYNPYYQIDVIKRILDEKPY